MIAYLLTLTLVWSVGLAAYGLLLRRVAAHGFNRGFLLATLVGGFALPLIPAWGAKRIATLPSVPAALSIWLPEVTVVASGSPLLSGGLTLAGWLMPLGSAVACALLAAAAYRLARLHARSRLLGRWGGMHVREVQAPRVAPCSFAGVLYVSGWRERSPSEQEIILRHERAHRDLGHSVDVVLVNLACAVAWFHPLAYALRRELRLVHEYQADARTLTAVGLDDYRRTILAQSLAADASVFAASFTRSPLRQRFAMMARTFRQNQFWRLATAALLLAAAAVACTKDGVDEADLTVVADANDGVYGRELAAAAADVTGMTLKSVDTVVVFDPQTNFEEVTVVRNYEGADGRTKSITQRVAGTQDLPTASEMLRNLPVYKSVDEMPRFPGPACPEDDADCFRKALLNYVYGNIRYPEAARTAGVEGVSVVSFVVGTDGELLAPEVLRLPEADGTPDAAQAIGKELLRVVSEMPAWEPGVHDGQPVQVRFNLPVRFALE